MTAGTIVRVLEATEACGLSDSEMMGVLNLAAIAHGKNPEEGYESAHIRASAFVAVIKITYPDQSQSNLDLIQAALTEYFMSWLP
jgi:hypothetical protein